MATNSKHLASNIFCYLEADVRRNKRKMGGFASWENFGTGFEIWIFLRFSCDVQVSKFWIFLQLPAIFRGPKNSQNLDFSAVSRDFEGRACPKILCNFPAMNRAQIWIFLRCPAIFRGPKKISKCGFSPQFLGISKYGLIKNFPKLGLPRSFLGILKGWTHPKKL